MYDLILQKALGNVFKTIGEMLIVSIIFIGSYFTLEHIYSSKDQVLSIPDEVAINYTDPKLQYNYDIVVSDKNLINELIKANNIDEWNGITIIFDNKHYMTQGISNELLEKLDEYGAKNNLKDTFTTENILHITSSLNPGFVLPDSDNFKNKKGNKHNIWYGYGRYIYCINGGIDVDYKKIAGFVKNIGIGKLLLLFGMGILLMTLEFGGKDNSNSDEEKNNLNKNTQETNSAGEISDNQFVKDMEEKIEAMVQLVAGVEKAEAFITIKSGSRKVVLTETPYNKSDTTENDKNGGNRVIKSEDRNYNTVYESDKDGNEVPYVVSVYTPEIMGVAVAIKGNITVENKENIIRTINTLTGIGINNISVIITN